MNRKDIIRMARRYGCVIAEDGPDSQCEVSFSADQLLALLQFAVAAEREACAEVCEGVDFKDVQDAVEYAHVFAAAIRARGQS